MKRLLRLVALALSCVPIAAQTTVSPILQPHQTFVDSSGNPCALCSLYTYAAGTSNPLATFTDSTGSSQNQNPIILDAAGGANIWLNSGASYKFVLKDSLGSTVWSVDNVSGAKGIGPCSSTYAIQFANSSTLGCDSTITINPASHALQIGGPITGPAFTLGNLGPIVSSWTLDITSPSTALNSLGAIPLTNLAPQGTDTVVMNAAASAGAPAAVAMPSGCTNGVNYSTSTHTWTCAATTIPLTNIASQAADSVVMNATASAAAPTAVVIPSGCANGVNYSTSTHSWSCVAGSATVCTGTTVPWSCYRTDADGTIEEWGEITVAPSGTGLNNANLNFPLAFTSYSSVTAETVGAASNTGDPTQPPCLALQTKSLTAATWFMSRCIIASAGGGNFDNALTLDWSAKGK